MTTLGENVSAARRLIRRVARQYYQEFVEFNSMPKKEKATQESASIETAPADTSVLESADAHWEDFNIEGTRAIQLHIASEDWDEIANAIGVFWSRVFTELDGRKIRGIDVLGLPDLGFDLKVTTAPQLRQTRLELCIERMEMDCCEDSPKCDELFEAAWQALERGLHISKVLTTYKDALEASFELRGGLHSKTLNRVVNPRRR